MSGFMGAMAGLYNPETSRKSLSDFAGLVGNRNDPRYAMAQKLLDQKTPDAIPGKGAAVLTSLAGIARGIAAAKLMGDAKQDGVDAAERQRTEASDFLGKIGLVAQTAAPFRWGGGPPPSGAGADGTPPAEGAASAAGPAAPAPGASSAFSLPDGYTDRVVQAESAGNPTARNPRSSATGAGQFIDSTWLDLARRNRPDLTDGKDDTAVLAMRTDPALSREMVGHYARENGGALQSAGLPVNSGTLYAAHVFGPAGATKLLQADPNGPAVDTLGAGVIRANPHWRGLTNGQVAAQVRMQGGGTESGPTPTQPSPGPALASKLDAAADPSPRGTAMSARLVPPSDGAAARMSPEQMQQAALSAASSGNPLLVRMAPTLAAQAQQAMALRDRQDARGDRQSDLQRRDQERAQDRAERDSMRREDLAARQQAGIDARVPQGYRWNADHSAMEVVPGGPMDPANLPLPAAPNAPSGYRWNADRTALQAVPGGPADVQQAAVGQNAPAGYRWTADRSGLEPVPGGPADASSKPPKMAADGVVKGITGNLGTLRQLDAAIEAVDKNPGAFGMEQGLPLVGRFGPQSSIDARGQVANIGSAKLHERSGAAVTVSEMPRLAPFIPQASDSADTARTKLQGMRRIVQESLQDQYDVYGPGNGYKAVPGHARALGLGDDGLPAGPPASATLPGGAAPRPASATSAAPAGAEPHPAVPAQTSGFAKQTALQAIEAARKRLGPDASDDDVVKAAREALYGQ